MKLTCTKQKKGLAPRRNVPPTPRQQEIGSWFVVVINLCSEEGLLHTWDFERDFLPSRLGALCWSCWRDSLLWRLVSLLPLLAHSGRGRSPSQNVPTAYPEQMLIRVLKRWYFMVIFLSAHRWQGRREAGSNYKTLLFALGRPVARRLPNWRLTRDRAEGTLRWWWLRRPRKRRTAHMWATLCFRPGRSGCWCLFGPCLLHLRKKEPDTIRS